MYEEHIIANVSQIITAECGTKQHAVINWLYRARYWTRLYGLSMHNEYMYEEHIIAKPVQNPIVRSLTMHNNSLHEEHILFHENTPGVFSSPISSLHRHCTNKTCEYLETIKHWIHKTERIHPNHNSRIQYEAEAVVNWLHRAGFWTYCAVLGSTQQLIVRRA